VRHIIAAKNDQELEVENYRSFLSIICALESPELTSVLQINWAWKQISLPNDDTIYFRGEFERHGEAKIVHAAASPRMGMPAAAILSTKMISAFRPQYLAMTGITAGMPGKTKFGDIIAADPSWDWGSGKWEMRNGNLSFSSAPHQLSITPFIRSKLRLLKSDEVSLAKIRQDWPADSPEHVLSLHIGPLASGASVLADRTIPEMFKSQNREILGIEMEAYGVFAAAEESSKPRPLTFTMKSVVDFADGNKDDRFQRYASYTSAQALRCFAENYL
jgi:nucleoside phosphorylase